MLVSYLNADFPVRYVSLPVNWHNYGKSSFFMRQFTINADFPVRYVSLPEGNQFFDG